MERKHSWLLLGLIAAFGLSFELMKRADSDSSLSVAKSRVAIDTGIDDSLTERLERPIQSLRHHARLGGLGVVTASELIVAPDQTTSSTALRARSVQKDQRKDQQKKMKNDQKKKKKKKNKKKKAKTSESPGESGSPGSLEREGLDDEVEEKTLAEAAIGGGAVAVAAQNLWDANVLPETMEEWSAYLLGFPDYKRTEQFVRLFQSGLVPPEVFFPVTTLMVQDKRTDMVELGVMALGAAPSTQSFLLLTAARDDQQGVSKIKNQIDVYLKSYIQLNYLKFLMGALGTDVAPAANHEAIRLLQIASDTYLKPAVSGQSTDQEGGSGETTPASLSVSTAALPRYFNDFLPLLSDLSQSGNDESVRIAASQTYAQLESLLTTLSTQVASYDAPQ